MIFTKWNGQFWCSALTSLHKKGQKKSIDGRKIKVARNVENEDFEVICNHSAIGKDFSQLQNGLAIISYWKLVGSVVILKTETIVLIDGSLDAGVVHNFWREREIGSKAAAFNYVDTSLSFVDITIQKKKNQTTVSFDNSDYFQNIAT